MSPRRIFATARRVLLQLSHDKRTLALIWLVPPLLVTLLRYVFNQNQFIFNNIAPAVLGIFPLITMFLTTSIAMLRERRGGTLDRLMTLPINKGELVAGYGLAFAIVALVQALITSLVVVELLDVSVAAGVPLLIGSAIMTALLGTSMGLFVSAFAKSEFQAVQFMPVFVLPQLLICGLFVPRTAMAEPLQWLSNIAPMTYSVDAMQQIAIQTSLTDQISQDFVILGGFIFLALFLGSLTIRRKDS